MNERSNNSDHIDRRDPGVVRRQLGIRSGSINGGSCRRD